MKKQYMGAAAGFWLVMSLFMGVADARAEIASSGSSAKFYPLFSDTPNKSGKIYQRPTMSKKSSTAYVPAVNPLGERTKTSNYGLNKKMTVSRAQAKSPLAALPELKKGKLPGSEADALVLSLFEEASIPNNLEAQLQ